MTKPEMFKKKHSPKIDNLPEGFFKEIKTGFSLNPGDNYSTELNLVEDSQIHKVFTFPITADNFLSDENSFFNTTIMVTEGEVSVNVEYLIEELINSN